MKAVSLPTWTIAASTGVRIPAAASAIPTRSTATVPTKLNVTIARARRATRTVEARSAGSEATSTTSALSRATSVPLPMAMPTSARASDGASLTPSPTIATLRPAALNESTKAVFCSGRSSARQSSMPSRAPTARAAPSPSPVTMATCSPMRFSSATAPAAPGRTASAKIAVARYAPSTLT